MVETQYCIAVGSIPEAFYAEIAANEAQREEWVALLAIDEIKGDRITPAYSAKLEPEFLKAQPLLVVDTRHFDTDFRSRLLGAIDDVDEQTDGVLLHGENFQALTLLQHRYWDHIKCVYIDPPYNTGNDGFAYRDSYQHSSWMAMIEDRLRLARPIMASTAAMFVSVDDTEQANLRHLMENVFGVGNFVTNLIWQKKYTRANDARFFFR